MLELDYMLNISAYLNECINKNKLELKCNGLCKLSKKIDEAEGKENKSEKIREGNFQLLLSTPSYPPVIKPLEPAMSVNADSRSLDSDLAGYAIPVFQPPRVS